MTYLKHRIKAKAQADREDTNGFSGTDPGFLAGLLTVADLEELLKIDRKTLYKYVSDGTIPYVKIQSNIRFKPSEIMAWIDAQSYSPQDRPNRH
jgi:excisionase family DNA binding protein